MVSIREQIDILKSKGLEFSSIFEARSILLNHSYYDVIHGYRDIFIDRSSEEKKYKEGTRFEDIYNLYKFDIRLKHLLLKYLFIVEENIKTHISYEFSLMYGETGYKDTRNFIIDENQDRNVINLYKEIKRLIKKNSNDDRVIHFRKKKKDIPIYVLISLFDLGNTRLFYFCCKDSFKNLLSKKYYNLTPNQFYSCFYVAKYFRNICAHGSRLYCASIKDKDRKLSDLPIHENMNLRHQIINNHKIYTIGKKDLFSVVIALRYLLKEEEFKEFYDQLKYEINEIEKQLGKEYTKEILDKMSFPKEDNNTNQKSWEEIINISKDKNGINKVIN